MTAQVTGWSDVFGRALDGIRDVGLAYIDADRAQEVPGFADQQAALFQQQQQQAATQQMKMQNMMIMLGVGGLVLFMLTRKA